MKGMVRDTIPFFVRVWGDTGGDAWCLLTENGGCAGWHGFDATRGECGDHLAIAPARLAACPT